MFSSPSSPEKAQRKQRNVPLKTRTHRAKENGRHSMIFTIDRTLIMVLQTDSYATRARVIRGYLRFVILSTLEACCREKQINRTPATGSVTRRVTLTSPLKSTTLFPARARHPKYTTILPRERRKL